MKEEEILLELRGMRRELNARIDRMLSGLEEVKAQTVRNTEDIRRLQDQLLELAKEKGTPKAVGTAVPKEEVYRLLDRERLPRYETLRALAAEGVILRDRQRRCAVACRLGGKVVRVVMVCER